MKRISYILLLVAFSQSAFGTKIPIGRYDSPSPHNPNGGHCDWDYSATWRMDGDPTQDDPGSPDQTIVYDRNYEACGDSVAVTASFTYNQTYTDELAWSISPTFEANVEPNVKLAFKLEVGATIGHTSSTGITISDTVDVNCPVEKEKRYYGHLSYTEDAAASADHIWGSTWEVSGGGSNCNKDVGDTADFSEGSETTSVSGKVYASALTANTDETDCPSSPDPDPGD